MAQRTDVMVESEIARLWAESPGSCPTIARAVGVSATTVRRVVTRLGLCDDLSGARRQRLHSTTEEQDVQIAERYAAGESTSALAAEFGLRDSHSVLHRVRRAGGSVARPGPRRIDLTPEQKAEAICLRGEGWSQERIARHLGVSQPRVSRTLREAGLRSWRVERHPSYKGTAKTESGYVLERVADDDPMASMRTSGGYVLQHRLVMARALDRPLREDESVHHVDGDRANNALSNLQVRQGNHGKGVVMVCGSCGSHDLVAVPIAEVF